MIRSILVRTLICMVFVIVWCLLTTSISLSYTPPQTICGWLEQISFLVLLNIFVTLMK